MVVTAIGKAAWRMARAAADSLGSSITGAVVTKYEHSMGDIPGLEIFEAGHPVPDENGFRATAEMSFLRDTDPMSLLKECGVRLENFRTL